MYQKNIPLQKTSMSNSPDVIEEKRGVSIVTITATETQPCSTCAAGHLCKSLGAADAQSSTPELPGREVLLRMKPMKFFAKLKLNMKLLWKVLKGKHQALCTALLYHTLPFNDHEKGTVLTSYVQ